VLATLAALAAAILFLTTGWPAAMLHSDGANIWSAKAKVLFTSPGPGAEFAAAATTFPLHPDYPLLNPLLQFGAYVQAGGLTLAFQRLPIVAFYPALLLAAIAAFRRHVPGLAAVAMALVLISADGLRAHAGDLYSDTMVMVGLLVAVDAWLRWCDGGAPAYFRLALLAATVTASGKNEGSMLVVVAGLAIAVARLCGAVRRALPPRLGDRAWLLLPVAVAGGQQLFNAAIGVDCDLFAGQGSGSFGARLFAGLGERAPRLIGFFGGEVVLGVQQTRLVFALLLVVVVLCRRRTWRTAAMVPALVTFAGLGAYGLVFAGTYWELDRHLATAGVRVALHLAPLALLATAMILGPGPRAAGAAGRP
jgi:hypothetical protein